MTADEVDLDTARSRCESQDSHLVFMETLEEQAFLNATISRQSPVPYLEYWIGLEKDNSGTQVWMDGTGVTFDNFAVFDQGGECFRLKLEERYLWQDHLCNMPHPYICEYTIGRTM